MDVIADIPWAVWVIVLPLAAGTVTLLLGRRGTVLVGLLASLAMVPAVMGLTWQVWRHGTQPYAIGGWGAPLGIDLHVDGLSVLMLLMTAGISVFISIYAVGYFAAPAADNERQYFWPLWLFLWGALNALFLSADVFNLYVTLELLTLAAVALVGLAGKTTALRAALRYLLASFMASLVYLLGVALLYAGYETLDLARLGQAMHTASPDLLSAAAATLITLGLVLKTALFPLHFWLPPAHANAPAPVSAALSALVVKASFYMLVRLWFEVFPSVFFPAVGIILGFLGAAAIIWGSIQALLARRLKLLVAYSTVAQLGYLFLLFPLAGTTGGEVMAWSAGILFAVSHAFAKAGMFLAAGTVMQAIGHDRIEGMDGAGQLFPMSFLTMGIAGVTLMGLPTSGTFVAKWMLLDVALANGHGWIVVVMLAGGLMAAAYLFRVLGRAFSGTPIAAPQRVSPAMNWAALILALVALLLGFVTTPALELLQIGK